MIRGRGFFTTPETTDRKALKLARKRILFNYTVRDENQEAIYGTKMSMIIDLQILILSNFSSCIFIYFV